METADNKSIHFQKKLHWRVSDVDTFPQARLIGMGLFVGYIINQLAMLAIA